MSDDTMITDKRLPNPQKVKWKNVAFYDNFEDASNHRASLIDELKVKVRRCGINKTKFVVKVGTVIGNQPDA